MALDMKRFVARFVEEAREHIEHLEQGIEILENTPADQNTINRLFRSAHTIKGSARMLKLLPLCDTAHKLEDVLGALRAQQIEFSSELATLVLQTVDALAVFVDCAEQGKPLFEADATLLELLEHAAQGQIDSQNTASIDGKTDDLAEDNPPLSESEPLVEIPKPKTEQQKTDPDITLKTSDTVRIRLEKLDELIRLVGEVVSGHVLLNQCVTDLKYCSKDWESTPLTGLKERFKHVEKNLSTQVLMHKLLVDELHDKALILRMLPLSIVFDPAARVVRELARSVGKDVRCDIQGSEIELDRQMIDRLSDPIVHLLRNAIDHGIETPEVRLAIGKSRQGLVQLSAHQEGYWIVIVVRDDGGGLKREQIAQKALNKGFVSEQQLAALTDQEIMQLIFLPGFSTQAIITDLSGRGVGMDVVKKTIVDELHGVIDMTSDANGTAFLLKLPMSLAIMRVLLCDVSGMMFGFTAQYIFTLVNVRADELKPVADRKAVIVGNEFIPVLYLADLLGLENQGVQSQTLLLVVVKTHTEKLALVVDQLVDEQDRVIKPLPPHLHFLSLVTGMVMTGQNEWVSILNVPQLFKIATQAKMNGVKPVDVSKISKHILVIDDSLNTREIEKDVLEASGYRVTTAEDGVDGWHKACADHFDAILTDVEMPGLDGFSLTKKLRQDSRFELTPIIIVTSREKEEDKRKGIEVGADAYIVKGDFEQSNLVSTLRNLIG